LIPRNVQVLINTYKASQMRLINIIAKSVARGNVTAYRRAVLSSVNQELRALDKFSARWAKKEIPLSYREGAEKAYNEIRKANIEVKKVAINTKTVRLLVDNATGQLQDATQFVGRRIADDLRQAGIEAVAEKLSAGDTVKQAKANLISKLNKQGVVAIRDKAGRQVSLDAYASMVARTTTREATNTGTIDAVQEVGGDLVQMTSHASACPICQPLEGRVYSISGKSKKYPRLDIAFSGGYATIHPNCQHVLVPFFEEFAENLEKTIEESNRPFEIREKDKASIDAYNKDQAIKAERRRDRKLYEQVRLTVPNEAPKTFSGFRAMKRADSERYQQLRIAMNEATKP